MSLLSSLGKNRKRSRLRRMRKQGYFSLHGEQLEDRVVLSTLDLSGGAITYEGSAAANTLAVELVGTDYRFTDTENITVSATPAASCSGSGTMVVLCATSAVTSIDIDLLGGVDSATIGGLTLSGNLSVTADDVSLNGLVSSDDTVTINADGGAIRDDNASDPDIAAINCSLTAVTGIGKTTDANPTLEVDCTNLDAANTGSGGVFITDTAGGVAVGVVSAGPGDVTLTATDGSITESTTDTSADIIGATVNLFVTGTGNEIGAPGPVGGPSDPLETDVSTLLNASTEDGHMALKSSGNLPLGALNVGDAMILLTANGAITDGNSGGGTVNLTAAGGVNLTTSGDLSAIGTVLLPIRTAIGALTATTNDGGVFVNDSNVPGLMINTVVAKEKGETPFINGSNQIVVDLVNPHAGTHDLSVTATGPILLNSVTVPDAVTINSMAGSILDSNPFPADGPERSASTNILARTASLLADGGVGHKQGEPIETNNPIELTVESFSANTTNGSIFLSQGIAGTAESVVAGGPGNDVLVLSTGSTLRIKDITNALGNVTVTNVGGSLLRDNASLVNVTGQIVDLTGKSGIGTSDDPLKTTASELSATVSDPAIGSDPAALIRINETDGLSSVAAKTNSGDVKINFTGGSLSFAPSTDRVSPELLTASGAAVSFETTAGNVKLGLVDAGSRAVNVTAFGTITDDTNDGIVDIRGGTVTLKAGTGIGALGNEIDTEVATLNATTNTGDIFIREANALTLSASSNGVDSVTGSNIDVSNATGDLTLGLVSALGQVTLNAVGGAILDGNSSANNVTANTLNLVASSGIGGGNALETSVNSVLANGGAGGGLSLVNNKALTLTTSPAPINGAVSVTATGDLTFGTVNAPGQTVTLSANGALIDANGDNVNITADSATLNGSMVGSSSDRIDTDVAEITAAATTGGIYVSNGSASAILTLDAAARGQGADVDIDSAGNILLKTATALGDTVKLFAAGWIRDGNGDLVNIAAKNLDLFAPGGIGTANDPLETDVDRQDNADAGANDTFLSNTGSLALTKASFEGLGSGTLTFDAASITIDIAGTATLASGRSLVLRSKTGNIVFLDSADAIQTQGAGTITIQAGVETDSGGVAVLGNLKTAGGNILVTADRTITIGLLDAGTGDVTVQSLAGIIVDGNGTALNVISGTTTLSGAAPTAREAELDETFKIAEAAAASAEADAKETSAEAFGDGSFIVAEAKLAAEAAEAVAEQASTAADAAAAAQKQLVTGLEAGLLTANGIALGLTIAFDVAESIADAAQAVPVTGDFGAATIANVLHIAATVAEGVAFGLDIGLTAASHVLDDLEDESTGAQAELFAAMSTSLLATATAAAFAESTSIADAAADKAAINRDAAARVRDQAILARDQANVIGTASEPLGIQVAGVINVIAGPTDSFLRVVGATAVDLIQATGSVTLISTGAISDADAGGGADITALGLTTIAVGGIGTAADPLETRVATLNATNTASGDIAIANTAGAPAALDITGISNAGGGDVIISNQGSTAAGQGITVSGEISAIGAGAEVTINSGSPLTIDADITSAGAIVLEASETADAGDDLTVNSGVTIESTGSSVTLRAGDNITVSSGSTIQANTTITITADFNDHAADTTGANVIVAGALIAPMASIGVDAAADDDDTFTITPSAATPITVDAEDGSDTLNFTADGLPVTILGNQITAAGRQPVTFTNFEFVNITNAGGGGSVTLLTAAGVADALILSGTGQGAGTFTLNGGIPISFSGVTSFTFNAGDMDDATTVSPFATAPLPWNMAVSIDGGAGTDRITYNNVAGLAESTSVTATGPQAGRIDSPGVVSALSSQVVSFTNVEDITANANPGENEKLTVNLRDTSAADTAILLFDPDPGDDDIQLVGLFDLIVDTANYAGLTLNGNGGDDAFIVTPGPIPVFVDGGDPIGASAGDRINFISPGAFVIEPGPENDAGGFVGDGVQRVSFDHIEHISVGPGAGPGMILGTNGDDDITITARDASSHPMLAGNTPGVRDFTVSVNNGIEMLFIDQAQLFADAMAGDDDIVLRTPAPNNAVWDVDVFIAGGPPAAPTSLGQQGDVFELETPGAHTVTYSPTGIDTATIDVATLSSVINIAPFIRPLGGLPSSSGGVEQIVYQGLGGGDTLTMNGADVDDNFVVNLTNGASGSHRSNLAPTFDFTGATAVTVSGGTGGFDVLTVLGSAGVDTVTSTAAVVTIAGQGTATLGANLDRFELYTFGSNDNIDLDLNVPGVQKFVDAGDGSDIIDMAGSADATILGGEGNDNITGTDDPDVIFGGPGQDVIVAGGGNDDVYGEEGNDTITGGAGTDRMHGGDDFDIFIWNVGDGSDFIDGGTDAADILNFNGSPAAEAFILQPGGNSTHNNVILGAAVVDTHGVEQINVNGLAGADTFTVADLITTEVVEINLDLGVAGSTDLVTINGRTVADNILVFAAAGVVKVAGLEYDIEILNAVSAAPDLDRLTLLGNDGDDILKAAAGVAGAVLITLDGGADDDFLEGGAGDDQFFGNEGEDTMIGGLGNDTFDGGSGFDTILIEGTSGNDSIFVEQASATALAVRLNGVDDTDTLVAGTVEQAQVEAGQGDDTIAVRVEHGLNATPTNSLRVTVHASEPNASDRLVVVDQGIGNTVQHHQGTDERSGTVIVGALSPVSYEGIEYVDIVPLDTDPSSVAFGGTGSDGLGRIVVFHPDTFSHNNSFLNPTELTDLAEHTAKPNINPGAQTDPFGLGFDLNGDVDWYRFIAPKTGTFQFQALFDAVPTLANGEPGLPGDGLLRVDMFQADGTQIVRLPAEIDDAIQTIGTKEGERYLLRVQGATPDSINLYDVNVVDLDLLGPQIFDPDGAGPEQAVQITGDPTYNIFDVKPVSQGPTPLVNSLTINIQDLPIRFPGFVYEALDVDISSAEGHYTLIGDHNGIIPISDIIVINAPVVVGGLATATIELQFDFPLPDDRYTLTLSDSIVDLGGNKLDGESNAQEPQGGPTLPSGDTVPGGDFVARFTVDSRAELGVWAAGSVYVDTNGNFVADPENKDNDDTNEDISYVLGFTTDNVFAGNFSGNNGVPLPADGFDKLGVYGLVGGAFRWLIDTDNNGVPNMVVSETSNVNGLPLAGNFDGLDGDGDEVGLKSGATWRLDTNHDYLIDTTIYGNMVGYPVVGDFDGDGVDDLGAWTDDRFQLDLSSVLSLDPAPGSYNININGNADVEFTFGFPGPRERPVSADFDGDGLDDLGLWTPDRIGTAPTEGSEWYLLISGGQPIIQRIISNRQGQGNIVDFTPVPFGNDIFAQYGNEFALPVVGNFDPPVVGLGTSSERQFLSYTNAKNQLDVNDDGQVSPIDVLHILNYVNSYGVGMLPVLRVDAQNTGPYLDVNGDQYINASDALLAINFLNARAVTGGEGEQPSNVHATPRVSPDSDSPVGDDAFALGLLAGRGMAANDDAAPATGRDVSAEWTSLAVDRVIQRWSTVRLRTATRVQADAGRNENEDELSALVDLLASDIAGASGGSN